MVRFAAPEHRAGGTVGAAAYEIDGSERGGWRIRRDGALALEVGAGYRLVRTSHCGICATDLARHRLPFPLPQVTGHEIVARDTDGRLVAVEINASHASRRLPPDEWCETCAAGLPTHCPERLVVGIHALPGGFAPWVLAPIGALVPLPPGIDPVHGTLLEPFAAAWHAVETIAPRAGDTVAVLGPGKLGSLLVAALVAYRERSGASLDVLAVVRSPGRAAPAAALGATRVVSTGDAVASGRMADVVVDATGSPAGLATALRLARREVHVKTTSGEPACGLAHATELVVDELRIARARDAAAGDDVAVVASLAGIDAAIRPVPGVERARVRPRGLIALAENAARSEPLVRAILEHGIRITTSRCGDFHRALGPFVASLPRLERAGLVTHVLAADRLAYGYATARSAAARKVVMRHG